MIRHLIRLFAMALFAAAPTSCRRGPPAPEDAGPPVPATVDSPTLALDTLFGTCVVARERLRCWGEAVPGAPDGTASGSAPSIAGAPAWPAFEPWADVPARALAGANGTGCVLTREGGLKCASRTTGYEVPLERVSAASADGDVGCAIHGGGRLSCWRFSETVPTVQPFDVAGVVDAKEVLLGDGAGCARTAAGKAYCWSLSEDRTDSPPTPFFAFASQARDLAFWGQQLCAFSPEAPPQCVGAPVPAARELRTLDDRYLAHPPLPAPPAWIAAAPALPPNATRVRSWLTADGGARGCVISDQGTLACFGPNYFGEVGDGTTLPRRSLTPVALKNVVDVALGRTHSCARLATGQVACWGSNLSRQLGRPLVGAREFAPAEVGDIVGFDLAEQGCVVLDSGAVHCWGKSYRGEAGAESCFVEPPRKIATPEPFTHVSTGANFSCAWGAEGVPHCWGHNLRGELGDGTRVDSALARPMSGLAGVVAMAGQCALVKSGALACWGDGSLSGAAAAAAPQRPYPRWSPPVRPRLVAGVSGRELRASPSGRWPVCVLSAAGSLSCLRPGLVRVPIPDQVADVAVSDDRGCARTKSGAVWCWDEVTPMQHPRRVTLDEPVSAIAVSSSAACAVQASGRTYCWGKNVLARGDSWSEPHHLNVGEPAAQLALTEHGLGCVRNRSGLVTCWDPTTSVPPTAVPELAQSAELVSGTSQICGVRAARVHCYGRWYHSSHPVILPE